MSQNLAIPTSTDEPFYSQITTLTGVAYILTFEYRARLRRWAMTLGRGDGTPIISGIAVVTGTDLFRGYRYLDEVPPGELVVVPYGSDDATPDQEELVIGGRCELTYIDPEDP
jgi:hypothetical protein